MTESFGRTVKYRKAESEPATSRRSASSRKAGRRRERIFVNAAIVLAALFSLWPIVIMALEGYDIDLSPLFAGNLVRLVGGVPFYSNGIFPTPINYLNALKLIAFPRLVENSLVIAGISIGIALAVGIPASYILARVQLRGRGLVAVLLFVLRTISPFAVIFPLYIYFTKVELWNSLVGMALAELVIILSVVVWMVKGFFADIPREVYDAAAVFGKREMQIFRLVILPMVIPGIVVTALFAFILVWNEFLIASVMSGPATKTVAVGIWTGLGGEAGGGGFRSIDWSTLNAGGTLALAPAFAVMLTIRKYLARGYSLATAR